MSRLIASIASHGIAVSYRCKSIYAKNHGRRCKEIGTDECYKCNLCQAEMKAADATRLLNVYGRRLDDKS